jgi:hypothetical protein
LAILSSGLLTPHASVPACGQIYSARLLRMTRTCLEICGNAHWGVLAALQLQLVDKSDGPVVSDIIHPLLNVSWRSQIVVHG